MKRFLIVLGMLCLALTGYATIAPEVADTKSQSLGKVRALSETALNPSYLSFLDEKRVGVSVMNHFQLQELNTVAFYGLFPNKYLDAAVRMSDFGYEDYHEWRVQVGLAKKILHHFSAGLNIHYRQTTGVYEEDIPSVLGVDLGCNFNLSPDLRCGLLYESIVDNAKKEDCLFSCGLAYRIIPGCYCLMEYATNLSEVTRFSWGVDYELLDSFRLRVGCYTQRFTPTFGLSFSWNRFVADLACDKHTYLGYTTSLGLSYRF